MRQITIKRLDCNFVVVKSADYVGGKWGNFKIVKTLEFKKGLLTEPRKLTKICRVKKGFCESEEWEEELPQIKEGTKFALCGNELNKKFIEFVILQGGKITNINWLDSQWKKTKGEIQFVESPKRPLAWLAGREG